MVDSQTIQNLLKMIECKDPISQQLSTNIIGQLAKYGLLSKLSPQYSDF